MEGRIQIHVLPRQSVSWDEFVLAAPPRSIALDGYVLGGPRLDKPRKVVNFDHHSGVIRDATMSTAKQVYVALKSGLMKFMGLREGHDVHVFINDTDQDTCLACWQLLNYAEIEGVKSSPIFNRLLWLTDVWDITGGAFPMLLKEKTVEQHNWVFRPYTNLRKSGALATANEAVMRDNLEAVLTRIDQYYRGDSGQEPLDVRYRVIHSFPRARCLLYNEESGNEARYWLYTNDKMDSFICRVATRPDGRYVYSLGMRGQYEDYPIEEIYNVLNRAEGLTRESGWNGSTIVGGCSRLLGSGLDWPEITHLLAPLLDLPRAAAG